MRRRNSTEDSSVACGHLLAKRPLTGVIQENRRSVDSKEEAIPPPLNMLPVIEMMTTTSRINCTAGLALILMCSWSGPSTAAEEEQRRRTEGVEPTVETWLRAHLRKLDGWGVSKLLRTEQTVDREQKHRANTSTNPRELALLADDEDRGVRFYVAANPYTPLGSRIYLAGDADPTVRTGAAMALVWDPLASSTTRQIVTDLAAKLARDPNVLVRLALVENKQLPPTLFDTLAADPDEMIRWKLAANLDTPGRVLTQLSSDVKRPVRIAALQHRNLPIPVLASMAADSSVAIRRAVCVNINTPLGVLSVLSGDLDPEVRRLTARHPNTPLETLERLARDTDPAVILAVARHPGADRSLLTELAYNEDHTDVRLTAQDRLQPLLRREIRDDILERWDVE